MALSHVLLCSVRCCVLRSSGLASRERGARQGPEVSKFMGVGIASEGLGNKGGRRCPGGSCGCRGGGKCRTACPWAVYDLTVLCCSCN